MGVKQTLPAVADNNGQRNINNNNNNNNLIHLTKQLSGRSGGGGGDASHYSAMHISNHHAGLSSTMTTGSNSTYGLPPETQTLVRQLEVDWCAFDKHFDTIAALLVDRLLQCEVYDSNAPHVDEHGNINNNNNNMTANLFSCNSFGSMPESFDDTLRSEDSVLMVPPSRRQPYSVPCPVPLQHSSSHPATHSGRIYPQAATAAAAAASVNGLRASTVSVSSIGSNASPRPCPPVNHLSATYSNNASTDMLQPHPPPLSAESCVPPHAAFAKISVALRLAVLDLGHIGVRRVLDALAFSATGECRGDRERLWGMTMPASNTGVLNNNNNNNNMGKHFSNGDVASLTACKRFAASTDSNSNNNLNSSMKKGMSSNSAFSHNNHNHHHNNNNIGGAKSVSSMGALSMTVGSQQQQQSQARMIASMQQQQCQMRMAPSTFGEQSYNSVLLLSMHARSLPNAASLSWDFNAPGSNSFQQIGGGGGGGSGRTTTHSTPHPPGCSMSDINVRPSRVFPAFPPAPEEPMMAAVMTSVSGGGVLQQLQSSFSGASYGGMGTNNHLDATTDGNELRPDFMPRAVQSLCDPSDDKGLGLRNMHHTDVINMVCHTLAHLHLSPRDIQDFLEAAVDITRNVTRDILEENNNNNNNNNNNSSNNNNNSNSKLSVVMTHKTLHHTNFVVKELTDFVFTPRLHHSLRILRFISAGEVSNNTTVNALSVGALPPLSRTPSRCPSRNGAFEVQHVSASNNNNNNNNNTNNSNVNVLCSQAHQYFREMSVMDVGGSANNDAANNNNNNNSTQLARQQTRWQEEILVRRRCFVLHYAETLGAMRAGRDSNSQPSSQPSTTLSPHPPPSRSQGGTKVPGETSFSSTSFLSAVETGNGNGGNGGGGRSATAAVASSTQQSSAATSCSEEGRLCWPLRTRLLSLQQHYLYIFDAMSSSLLLTGSSSAEVTSAVPAAIAAEMHSPIVLVDTSCVTAGADFRVIKTGAESETLRLHPSRRVRRRENQPPHPPFLDGSQPNAVRGSSVADVDVYRVQSQSDGQMMLLTVPAGAPVLAQHNNDIPMSHHNSKDKSRTQSLSSSGLRGDDASAARSTASHCLSPPPPPPPPPPPTASNTNSHSRSRMGSGVEPPDSTSSSSSRYAFTKDVAVVHGSDPVTFIVYPLRFIHRGVLHHLFFQNASTRVQWAESLMVLSTVNQSRAHALRVAQAEQYTDFFIRRRISYPIGPSAFEYVDMLGAGAFGRVLLVRHILTGKPFALKVVRKTSFHGVRNVIEARRERAVMESLDCPYILKLHTTFQTDSRFYLLLDYLSGGELLLHTQKAKGHRFDEATARFFVAELAIAVEHLRLNGVVHRDVKGDNLVLDDEGHVVLTDFGFAKKITTEEELFPKKGDNPAGRVVGQRTSCGTRAYIAPEVIDLRSEGYGLEVDWWSMGVVLFTLLTGFFPFLKQTEHDTNQAITQAPLQFPPQMALTEAAKSVLLGLMNKNPAKRIAKLSQLKKHPFFAGFDWEACEQRKLKPPFQLHKDAFVKPTSSSSAARRLKENVAAAREDILLAQQQLDDPQPMDTSRHHTTNSNTNRSKRTSTTAPTTTNQRYVAELAEECEELRRVEAAYGEGCTPYPTHVENNLFGSLYQRQELLGSMRDIGGAGGAVGDVDADTDYIPPLFTEMSGLWHCAREPSLSASFSAAAAAQLMDDCFEPVVEDYCEAAYASASDIRPVDARMGSVTSFYRPVYDPR